MSDEAPNVETVPVAEAEPSASAAAAEATVFGHDGRRLEGERAAIKVYNFRNPSAFKIGDLRHLDIATRKFIDHLSARLSTFLRMECIAKLEKMESNSFSEFTATVADPTYIALFQIQGLDGIGVLELTLPASLAIADRMLGGKGKLTDTSRNLTEIETALVEDAAGLILTEWTRNWPEGAMAYTPTIAGHDSSARFLNTAEDDAVHIIVQAELTIAGSVGRLQIAAPLEMLSGIMKKLEGTLPKAAEARPKTMEWRTQFDGIHVPVIAEWVVKQMAVRDVIDLKPGDVIEMGRELIGQTHVRLANTTEFIGTAGVEDGCVAVQLTQRKNRE